MLQYKNKVKLYDTYGVLYVDAAEFLFDLEDLPVIQSRDSWYKDKDGYLVSSYFFDDRRRFVRFHRIIMNAQPNQCVDHINKNKADNRKQNLRCCERADNDLNRNLYVTNTSGVSGVYFDRKRNKWVASITYRRTKIYIGRFDIKEDAVRARLDKEMELYKEFAPQRELWEAMHKEERLLC